MPKFAANLSLMFNEMEFLDRFAAARRAGFSAVEYLFPYAYDARILAERLKANGLQQVLFNGPPGDWEGGDRGMAALPGREAEFSRGLGQALAYAETLGCPRIHVMAGIPAPAADLSRCESVYVDNLRHAAAASASAGVAVMIEPLNPTDFPGYFLNSPRQARRIIEAVGAHNLRLQYDFYHQQMAHGALSETFRAHLDIIGHVQIAGVPGRHEPDESQEISFPYILTLLDASGYDGWVGCEYRPRAGTEAGLAWARKYGVAAGPG
ncbi:MAG: 2-dehydrotetronate isomerase [Rhodospirillaceae bacterium]|jgi:hydroxypyruvate isomerase|nr:2-dehydrotetronate isomerase [Rhodospirillaceae bacterium]